MNPASKMIVLLASSPLIVFLVHMAASRLVRNRSAQIVVIISAFAGEILMALLLWNYVFRFSGAFAAGLATEIFYAFIIYNALAYTYFHLFNMSETARRIRILYEIDKKGALSQGEIAAIYGTSDILDIRLERLLAARQLEYVDGRYRPHGRLLYFASLAVAVWRNILGFGKFYSKGGGYE